MKIQFRLYAHNLFACWRQYNDPDKNHGMKYVIARILHENLFQTRPAAFAGYLEKREGPKGVLRQARRIWEMEGTSKPQTFDRIELTNIIEVIDCTNKAQKSIKYFIRFGRFGIIITKKRQSLPPTR